MGTHFAEEVETAEQRVARRTEEAYDLFERILSDMDTGHFTLRDVNEDAGALVRGEGGSIPYFAYKQEHLDILEKIECIAKNEDGSYYVLRDSLDPCELDLVDEDIRREIFGPSFFPPKSGEEI